MATRDTYGSATPGAITGDNFMDNLAAHVKKFYDTAALPLTAVGGTANAVTATLDPPLVGALVEGMRFGITWPLTNTANVTLSINGGTALAVVDAGDGALSANALTAGLRSTLEYYAGKFRITTSIVNVANIASFFQLFTSSGTWNKPAGYDANRLVTVELWGAGGGGGSATLAGGGGGGAFMLGRFRLGDLPSSVAVTVGTGGAIATNGGNTTFGSLLTARGGKGAASVTGGDGAGMIASDFGGGNGGAQGTTGGSPTGGVPGGSVTNEFGGGGGGGAAGGAVAAGGGGGLALRGGGGGGGSGAGTALGGTSVYAGNGGNEDVAGQAPSGGGGRNAAGGRGEARVYI